MPVLSVWVGVGGGGVGAAVGHGPGEGAGLSLVEVPAVALREEAAAIRARLEEMAADRADGRARYPATVSAAADAGSASSALSASRGTFVAAAIREAGAE